MDKVIVTSLLIMAGVISSITLFNAMYPAIGQSSDALTSMERRVDTRIKSQIEIVHAAKSSSGSDVYIWVKNIGSTRIVGPETCDVFFGPQTDFSRISYNTSSPFWDYVIENGTDWNPTSTLRITIHDYVFSAPGTRYFTKVILPSGVLDEYYFSD